jgi:hypothetical protein
MNKILLAQVPLGQISGTGNFAPWEAKGGSGSACFQLESILSMVVGFLTIVAGLAFLIYFVIGGLTWVTAGGDAKKTETAKTYMTSGVIGLIVVVASYSIVWLVGKVLGIDILNPTTTINSLTTGKCI